MQTRNVEPKKNKEKRAIRQFNEIKIAHPILFINVVRRALNGRSYNKMRFCDYFG